LSGSERTLAAIVFTDIVGYARLTQGNEELTIELLEELRKDSRFAVFCRKVGLQP